MKMRDIGKKSATCMPTESSKGNERKYYPTISMTSEQMPDMKDCKVGEKVSMHIIGELQEVRKTDKGTDYRIEVRECGMMDSDNTKKEAFYKNVSKTAEKATEYLNNKK